MEIEEVANQPAVQEKISEPDIKIEEQPIEQQIDPKDIILESEMPSVHHSSEHSEINIQNI